MNPLSDQENNVAIPETQSLSTNTSSSSTPHSNHPGSVPRHPNNAWMCSSPNIIPFNQKSPSYRMPVISPSPIPKEPFNSYNPQSMFQCDVFDQKNSFKYMPPSQIPCRPGFPPPPPPFNNFGFHPPVPIPNYPYMRNYPNYQYFSRDGLNKSHVVPLKMDLGSGKDNLHALSKTSGMDSLMDHNYSKPQVDSATKNSPILWNDPSEKEIRKNHLTDEVVCKNEMETDLSFDGNNDKSAKKRKYSSVCKDSLYITLDKGFKRESIKLNQEETPSLKKRVQYIAPDGTTLTSKKEVEKFLDQNPHFDLKIDNFSFDSRITLSNNQNGKCKKPRKIKLDSSQQNSQIHFDSQKLPSERLIIDKNDHKEDSVNFESPPLTISHKSSSSMRSTKDSKNGSSALLDSYSHPFNRQKRIITRCLKRIQSDNGGSVGSECPPRKKIPLLSVLVKCHWAKRADTHSSSIFGYILSTFEFSKTFGIYLRNCDTLTFPTLNELVKSIEQPITALCGFMRVFTCLLRNCILYTACNIDISSLLMVENILSMKWDLIMSAEIFSVFYNFMALTVPESTGLSNTLYAICNNQLLKKLDEHSIFELSPLLKAYSLQYMVDVLLSTSYISSRINISVESLCQARRDKYHLEAQLRQIKTKIRESAKKEVLEPPPPIDEQPRAMDVNGCTSPIVEDGCNTQESTEIQDIEKQRDEKSSLAKEVAFEVRAHYFGSDRFGRQYYLPKNYQSLIVEGHNSSDLYLNTVFSKSHHIPIEETMDASITQPQICIDTSMLLENPCFIEAGKYAQKNKGENPSIKKSPFVFPDFNENSSQVQEENFVCNTEYEANLLDMMIEIPSITLDIVESDLKAVVDLYAETKLKRRNRRKNATHEEFADGWWRIEDIKTFTSLFKSLNQKGSRELHLFRAFNRHSDYINKILTDQDMESDDKIEIQPSFEIQTYDNSFMDSCFISGFGSLREETISFVNNFHDNFDSSLLESLNGSDCRTFEEKKNLIVQLIVVLNKKCERKFDKTWLSKFEEIVNDCVNVKKLHILCTYLKVRVNPNLKICQLCDSETPNTDCISECSDCLLTAHDKCLDEPMKIYKKTKVMCSHCYAVMVERNCRFCVTCSGRSGKLSKCTSCPNYYHVKCLVERSKTLKSGDRYCQNCVNAETSTKDVDKSLNKRRISKKDVQDLLKILSLLESHNDGWPFLSPVDGTEVPTYFEIISQPMDLGTIKKNVREQVYSSTKEFYRDVTLIFENCQTFNEDESKVGRAGIRLKEYFEKVWSDQ